MDFMSASGSKFLVLEFGKIAQMVKHSSKADASPRSNIWTTGQNLRLAPVMRFAQRLSISHAGISFARKRSKTHRKPFKGYEYMVVSMVGFSNFPSPAVNYPVMCAPVFESQVFFDAFEECTKLSVFFFDIIGFLRWQADFKSDDLNPTVIRLKIGQLAMDSVEDTDIAPKSP